MNILRRIFGRPKLNEMSWQSGETTYEGFPLLLRKPSEIDYDGLPESLLVVVHHLEKTKPDGLPYPDYNETLADFDHEILNYLGERRIGCPVLIETFGHKRNYYFYCHGSASPEEMRVHFDQRYPNMRLEISKRADPGAKFIRQYAKEHF